MRLVTWLLNLVYAIGMTAAMPWLIHAAITKRKYRQGLLSKFLGLVPRRSRRGPCVWCHAVSVGEVNVLAPFIAELTRQYPELDVVISATTRTGYQLAKNKYRTHLVCYCPLDFSWAVRNALRRLKPDMIVLAELELWPNLIRISDRKGIPVSVINGRLSEKSARGYRRFSRLLRPTFQAIRLVAAQSEIFQRRFIELGVHESKVKVTGSMKFDGAEMNRSNSKTQELGQWACLRANETVFLAGSTQQPEEAMALQTFSELSRNQADLRLIVVPRHPERFAEVAELLERSGIPWSRRSTDSDGRQPIILVDTIGELAAWWGLSDIAYVGGSMGNREGQNMIEPAAYGAAVCFGPRTKNFRDVVALLLADDAAVVVQNQADLTRFVTENLKDPAQCRARGERAQRVIAGQLGAVAQTVELVMAELKKDHKSQPSFSAA